MRRIFLRFVNVLTAFCMMIALVAVSPVQTALAVVPDVSLVLLPASQSVNLGASFNVTVQVQAGANVVDGVTVCLDFDPAVLQFNSFTVPATNPWDVSFSSATHDPANGHADTSRSTFGAGSAGTVDFVIVNFTALAVTGSTAIGFHAGAPRNTEVSVSAVVNDPASAVNATTSISPGTLQSITVTPANPTITLGQTQQFSANGTFQYGWMDITSAVDWHSSNEAVATVNGTGFATSVTAGTTDITANLSGVTSSPVSTLTVQTGAVDHIVISPASATITADNTSTYTAMAYNSIGGSWDVTSSTVFTINATAGGSWAANVYTPEKAGTWTVNGTYSGKSDTATLLVNPGLPNQIVIGPPTATITADDTQAYTANATDRGGNPLGDVTGTTVFSIESGAGGSWAGATYTPEHSGNWTVTGNNNGKTDTATLTVNKGATDHITIATATPNITTDDTATFTSMAYDAKGNSWSATSGTTFTINATAGGSWAANVYTPLNVGNWVVTGNYTGHTATAPLVVTGGVIVQLIITPSSSTINADQTQAYTVEAYDAVAQHWDVTSTVTYSINTTAGGSWAANVYTPEKAGNWTVTVTDPSSGTTNTSALTVNPGALDHIVISPDTATITADDTQAYTAEAFDQHNNSRGDVTGSTSFAIVEAPADGGSFGGGATYTPVKVGTWTVNGTYSGKSDTAVLTVTKGALDHIVMTPSSSTITADDTQAYSVKAYDQNNNDLGDVTSLTSFSISPSAGGSFAGAIYTAEKVGSWTVTANYTGKTTTSTLTVTVGALDHIVVTPTSHTLGAGSTYAFTATSYDKHNNTKADVTSSSVWESEKPGVATVQTMGQTSPGLVKAYSPGVTKIYASKLGKKASASITVTAAALQSVQITTLNQTISIGGTLNMRAIGSYADGSKVDITGSANWSSSNATIASISPTTGVVTASTNGTVTISTNIAGIANQNTNVTVLAPAVTLDSITVTPGSPGNVAGDTRQFTATGTYNPGAISVNLTDRVTWSSNSTSVAVVNSVGLATTYGAGTANISATYGGKTGSTTLTVSAPVTSSVKVGPGNPTVSRVSGTVQTIQLTATAVNSVGTASVVTNAANWTISGAGGTVNATTGLVTLNGAGTTAQSLTVQASYGGQSGTTTITINKDTKPPVVKLDSPMVGQIFNAPSVTVAGNVGDATSASIIVNSTPTAVSSINATTGSFSQVISSGLVTGRNNISVTATDSAGNKGSSGTSEITVDPTKPAIKITSPAEGFRTKSTAVTVTGTVNSSVALTGVTIYVNGSPVTATVSGGTFSKNVNVVPLKEGPNTLVVWGKIPGGDKVGTSGLRTVILDTKAPVVAITSPATGSYVNTAGITVKGTVDDPTITSVTLTIGATTIMVPVADGAFSQDVVLASGSNTITITAADDLGNASSPATVSVTYDKTKPQVNITSPLNNSVTNQGAQLVTGTVSDLSITSVTLTASSGTYSAAVLPDGTFSKTVQLKEGSNSISASAKNKAGTTGSSGTLTVTLDVTPPKLVIGLSDPTDTVILTVSSSELLQAAPTMGGTATTLTQTGPMEWTGVLTDVTAGTHTVTAVGTDKAGNKGTTASSSYTINSVSIAANGTGTVSGTGGAKLDITTNSTVTGQSITFTQHTDTLAKNTNKPNQKPKSAGIFLDIVASGNLTDSISSVYVEIPYDEDEIYALGIDEAKLQLFTINKETGQWEAVPGSASNVTGNYVYGTLTHLSKFGAFGSAIQAEPATPTTTTTTTVTTPATVVNLNNSGLSSDRTLVITSTGRVQSTTTLSTSDGKVSYVLAANTKVLNASGAPVFTGFGAAVAATRPAAPQGAGILSSYDMLPNGVTFDPAITLTMTYDPSTLPAGMDESQLYIAWYDGTQWVALDSTVDTVADTVSAQTSHFTQFSVIGTIEEAVPIVVTPPTTTTPTPEQKPASFTLSDLSVSPASVETGNLVTVKVLVTNTGDLSGTYTVTLNLNGAAVESRDITLGGGSSQTVTFTTTAKETGTYTVTIGDLSGSYTVTQPEVTQPSGTETQPSTGGETTQPVTPTPAPSGGMPVWAWILIAIAIVAVIGVGYWWYRRRYA